MRLLLTVASVILVAVPVAEASAQAVGTYRVRAGLGAQMRPEYLGSDGREWAPYPKVSIAKGDEPFGFGAPDDSFGIKLVRSGGFSIGPAAKIRSGRKDSDVGLPLGKVDRAVEIGAFAEQQVSKSFRLRGEVLKAVSGHDGLVGSLGADYVNRDGDKYLFSIGPRLRLADKKFHEAYFGVTPQAALATGLDAYNPGGGIYAVGMTSSANYALNKDWGLFGYGRYDRLVGDAAKSPVIRDIGSRDQFSVGAGLTYTFNVKI
ncbi:MipA/OmpV family protein [Sphingomonas sinipercae]|uniref:MipA/OmpV family protein n=1 Tax=Sphingomonas sinipercae TaxID=2714944 RepID=A0A6G7ZQH8_9SPHN|nr:MipA/OmpV family protein [Sphingomonas sinipercae]QIL03156.1 MipA/OmpV family protein [Sphingomonas sinipercae]